MLEVGNGGMNEEACRVRMSLWSLLAAPLIATRDLTHASPAALAILTNPEVIPVGQDPAGIQGSRVSQEGPIEVWVEPLSDGSKAVGLFVFEDGMAPASVNFRDIGLGDSATVRDLWARKDLGTFRGNYTVTIPFHHVVMTKVK